MSSSPANDGKTLPSNVGIPTPMWVGTPQNMKVEIAYSVRRTLGYIITIRVINPNRFIICINRCNIEILKKIIYLIILYN